MVLILSSAGVIFGLICLFINYYCNGGETDEPWFILGLISVLISILIGFGLLACTVPAKTITTDYNPDNVVQTNNQTVIFVNDKVYHYDTARFYTAPKENIMLREEINYCSYGFEVSRSHTFQLKDTK